MDYLKNLQNQPEKVRRRAAYIITGILGVLIVAVWLFIASYNMKQALRSEPRVDRTAENFRQSLPELRQTDSVKTELGKQRAAKANGGN